MRLTPTTDFDALPEPHERPLRRQNRHPEANIQRGIIRWLHAVLIPPAFVHHSAHEIRQGGFAAAKAQGIARGMGVLAGYADLTVVSGGVVAWLEVKAEGGRVSPAQTAFAEMVRAQGLTWDVVRSVEDAREALRDAGITTREVCT